MKPQLFEPIALYRECFTVYGDEPKIIIEHACKHGKIFLYFENRQALNMICTSTISDGDFEAEYIFAVCTKPEYRKKGIFRKRLEEVIGDAPCILIPENDSLFAFYERFGFSPIYTLEAEFEGNSTYKKTEITPEEIYCIYKNCFQFPKKPQKLFVASLKAHIEYGGKIFTDGKSAVLVYDGGITDIYATTPETAIEVAKSFCDGKQKVTLPLECENLLISQNIKYEKKKTAMGRNLHSHDVYINTLFN
jgi:GNAT superfamily N-acetyltransferase